MKLALTLLIVMAIMLAVWAGQTLLDKYRPHTSSVLQLLLALALGAAISAIGISLAHGGELATVALIVQPPFPLWAFILVLAGSVGLAVFGWLTGRSRF